MTEQRVGLQYILPLDGMHDFAESATLNEKAQAQVNDFFEDVLSRTAGSGGVVTGYALTPGEGSGDAVLVHAEDPAMVDSNYKNRHLIVWSGKADGRLDPEMFVLLDLDGEIEINSVDLGKKHLFPNKSRVDNDNYLDGITSLFDEVTSQCVEGFGSKIKSTEFTNRVNLPTLGAHIEIY